jgi:hypothetical protein
LAPYKDVWNLYVAPPQKKPNPSLNIAFSTDALIKPGEGGTTYLFVYDQRDKKFKRHEFASEEDDSGDDN